MQIRGDKLSLVCPESTILTITIYCTASRISYNENNEEWQNFHYVVYFDSPMS
jgi:hypothetical protein